MALSYYRNYLSFFEALKRGKERKGLIEYDNKGILVAIKE